MNKEKGLSLYLALIIMVILLGIVLGVSTILVSQIKTIKGVEYSVIAFYAADSGIERVLMIRDDPTSLNGYSETLENGAEYNITVLVSGPECTSKHFCIKSVGSYQGVKRAIEVAY